MSNQFTKTKSDVASELCFTEKELDLLVLTHAKDLASEIGLSAKGTPKFSEAFVEKATEYLSKNEEVPFSAIAQVLEVDEQWVLDQLAVEMFRNNCIESAILPSFRHLEDGTSVIRFSDAGHFFEVLDQYEVPDTTTTPQTSTTERGETMSTNSNPYIIGGMPPPQATFPTPQPVGYDPTPYQPPMQAPVAPMYQPVVPFGPANPVIPANEPEQMAFPVEPVAAAPEPVAEAPIVEAPVAETPAEEPKKRGRKKKETDVPTQPEAVTEPTEAVTEPVVEEPAEQPAPIAEPSQSYAAPQPAPFDQVVVPQQVPVEPAVEVPANTKFVVDDNTPTEPVAVPKAAAPAPVKKKKTKFNLVKTFASEPVDPKTLDVKTVRNFLIESKAIKVEEIALMSDADVLAYFTGLYYTFNTDKGLILVTREFIKNNLAALTENVYVVP